MLRSVSREADDVPAATAAQAHVRAASPAEAVARAPASLEQFLADIGTRAFRFAEVGLRNRDDSLDAVQDAMMKMLAYRDRPVEEWTPLFWSILRSRIVDIQRRRTFRLRWLLPAPERDDTALDWADDAPDPARAFDGRGEHVGELAVRGGLGGDDGRRRPAQRIAEEDRVAAQLRGAGARGVQEENNRGAAHHRRPIAL